MKDYNKKARIKKIAESNEYLVSLIETRELPERLKEALNGKQAK